MEDDAMDEGACESGHQVDVINHIKKGERKGKKGIRIKGSDLKCLWCCVCTQYVWSKSASSPPPSRSLSFFFTHTHTHRNTHATYMNKQTNTGIIKEKRHSLWLAGSYLSVCVGGGRFALACLSLPLSS